MFSTKAPKKPAAPPPPGVLRVYELMRVFLRRRHAPWEVVDHKLVQPIPTFYDDEDVDVLHLSAAETRGTYTFELHAPSANQKSKNVKDRPAYSDVAIRNEHGRRALIFARQQLLAEVAKKGCNVLFIEGWCLTVLQKGKRIRFDVEYYGRGAFAIGKADSEHQQPPFIELLGRTEDQMRK